MRFSDITKGIRATKPVELPLWGSTVRLAVRPLLAVEEGDALAGGRAYAVGKGVAGPKPGDRLYEIGVMAHTIAAGCLDADAGEALFFDGGVDQVLANLDTDSIAYLYEQQQMWQDHCCPRSLGMSGAEYIQYVLKCAGAAEGDDPLAMLRPATRASFTRTLASQHVNLLASKSSSGSDASTDMPSAASPPAQPDQPPA